MASSLDGSELLGDRNDFNALKGSIETCKPDVVLDMAAWWWSRGYVENMAEAIALAVDNDGAAGKVYNVADANALTTAQWIEAIGRAAGWQGKVVTVPVDELPEEMQSHADTDQHMVVDTKRIRIELGYKDVASIDQALAWSVAWERANPLEEARAPAFDYTIEDRLLEKYALGP